MNKSLPQREEEKVIPDRAELQTVVSRKVWNGRESELWGHLGGNSG